MIPIGCVSKLVGRAGHPARGSVAEVIGLSDRNSGNRKQSFYRGRIIVNKPPVVYKPAIGHCQDKIGARLKYSQHFLHRQDIRRGLVAFPQREFSNWFVVSGIVSADMFNRGNAQNHIEEVGGVPALTYVSGPLNEKRSLDRGYVNSVKLGNGERPQAFDILRILRRE